jgi:hypothetical protein
MALLRETSTGKTLLLEPEHVVGRALTCSLRLRPLYVSTQHALLRWVDPHWEVKDLASSNGTYLDGRRIDDRQPATVPVGSKIAFGRPDEQWELVDASPPRVMLVPIDGGEPVLLEGELLALPSTDDPDTTIYRGPGGLWILEQADASVAPLANGQMLYSGGRAWRFCCPDAPHATSRFAGREPGTMLIVLADLELSFSVSRDEEFVELRILSDGRTLDVGTRAFNYQLLTLARRRLADAKAGIPETSCGWVYLDDLAKDLNVTHQQINVDVWRIRKSCEALGIADAASIVERRPPTRQLRIGTGKFTIAVV